MFSTRLSDRRRRSKVMRHLRKPLLLELLEDRTVPSLAVGLSFDGIDDHDSSCGCYPPDTNAAVGNNFVVETVNIQIRMFNKTTGAVLLDEPLGTLFGTSTGGDPYVVYDDIADRWYVTAFNGSDSGLFLAVSDDGNPVDGSWTTYELTDVGGFPDYQKLGFNKDAIFISYNDFGVSDPGPAAIASIDKTAALTGTLSYFVSHPAFQFRAMPPAQMHGDTLGGVEWFVSTDGTDAGGNTMRVTKLTNYLSNSPVFTYTSLPVTQYQSAVQADQPGGSVTVFPNTTTYQVQYRNGHLVTAMASGTAADGFVYPKGLYYQIDVSSGTPTLLQEGVIDPGAGVAVQMPSVDEVSGNLGFTWIESSSSEFLSMWVGALDTSGNFDSAVVAPGGGFFDYNGRLGDYSTTVLDPDGNTFWSANEYIGSDGASNIWRTYIASFTLGLGVVSSTPARGSIVTTKPTSYVINFSDPVNPGSVQPSDFTVTSDGISHAATGVTLNGTNTQATFTFGAEPVTIQGAQQMAIAAGAITRASDGGGILPFDATFRYDELRMKVISTYPAGPLAGVPMTTYVVNLNEAVDPLSVSESDLVLSQGTVLGYSLENANTTIRFTLDGITSEGTLDVSIAAGALADEFGNPNLPFANSYTLVTSMAVYSSTPAEGDIITGPIQPKDFVINFTLPYNVDGPGDVIDAGDLTVNGIPADSVDLDDPDTVTFHFISPPAPPSVQGEWTMHMAAGVVDAAAGTGLPDPGNLEWTATFRYDAVPMEVVSTVPAAGPAVQLPLTTFDVNLNEAVDPLSVNESDLALSQGTVTDFEVLPGNTTIRFTLSGINTEGTLNAGIAAGALTDQFGNPSLAFAGSYTLDIGTVPFPTPLAHVAPLGSLIYDPSFSGNIAPAGDTDSFTINVDAGQTLTIVAHPSPTADILWVGPNSLGWNTGTYGINQIDVSAFASASLAGYSLLVVDASAGGLSILQSRAADIAAFVAAGGGLITDNGGNFDFSWTPHAAGLSWVAQDQDTVLLTAAGGTHPVTAGLTNAGLSNWGNSQHTYFSATAGLTVLATNPTNDANILAGTYGAGRVVYFGLHPTGHQPTGESEQLIRQAVAWAKGPPPAPFVLDLKLFNPSSVLTGVPEIVGNDVIIQTAGPTTAGTYTVQLGASSGTGQYTVEIILNAAVEKESYGGIANNSPGTAQDLNASFIPLIKGATRGAVLGQTDAVNSTTTVYSADFETTTGVNSWTIASITNGLWHRSIGHGPDAGHSSTNSMYFGSGEKYNKGGAFTKGNYEVKVKGKVQRVAGTITSPNINLSAGGQITLNFNYLLQTQGSTTLDLAQLQIKPTAGSTWTTLTSYNGAAESSSWRTAAPVDLSAYGGQTVQLRYLFDSVDAKLNNFEGWYVDDVKITQVIPHDNYSFTVGAGPLTVVLEALAPGDINVVLRNAAGTTTLATGAAGPANVDKVIYNLPLAAGTYNLAITGQANVPYSLVVTQGAVFDLESNDTLATAQPLGTTQVALGYLEFQTGLSWVAEHQDTVLLTALGNTHPVTAGLTNAGLSGWGNSQHSYFTDTADLGILATNPSGQANILAGNVGFGRVAYFGLDPSYHQPTGDTEQLIRNAVTWTGGAAPNVLWVGPHSLGWNTIGAVVTQITISDFATHSFAGFDVIYVDPDATSSGGASILYDRAGDIAAFVASGGGLITDDGGSFDAPDFGWVPTGPGSDVYSFTASVGQMIDLFTATPFDGLGEPGNNLDPHLRLFNPSGAEVGTRTILDSQGNERVVYKVPSGGAGTYKIEITAEGGAGHYLLDPVAVSGLADAIVVAPSPTISGLADAIVVAPSPTNRTRLGAETLGFLPTGVEGSTGALFVAVPSNATTTPAPVVVPNVTATAPRAVIGGAISQTADIPTDAPTSDAWQEPTPTAPPGALDVQPAAPARETTSGEAAALWQPSASAAVFADPDWPTALAAQESTAPPEGASAAAPTLELLAAMLACALVADARRAPAETRKRAALAVAAR